jgi:hypothetical protein
MLYIVVPMLVNLSTSFMFEVFKDALLELLRGRGRAVLPLAHSA